MYLNRESESVQLACKSKSSYLELNHFALTALIGLAADGGLAALALELGRSFNVDDDDLDSTCCSFESSDCW